jgi:hypothetical protein
LKINHCSRLSSKGERTLLLHTVKQSFFNRGFGNRPALADMACEIAPDMACLNQSDFRADFFQEEEK